MLDDAVQNELEKFGKGFTQTDLRSLKNRDFVYAPDGREEHFGHELGMESSEPAPTDAIVENFAKDVGALTLVGLKQGQRRPKRLHVLHELTAGLTGLTHPGAQIGADALDRIIELKRAHPPQVPDAREPSLHDQKGQFLFAGRDLVERPLGALQSHRKVIDRPLAEALLKEDRLQISDDLFVPFTKANMRQAVGRRRDHHPRIAAIAAAFNISD
jgi:hypothetical protein